MNQDPVIGYDNLFEQGTVAVTSQEAEFPKENAYDWFTDDFWKPTAGGPQRISVDMGVATPADYVAVAAHDLFTQSASLRVQTSVDGVAWTNVGDEIVPADNSPLLVTFAAVSARYWGVRFTSAAPVSVGVLSLGAKMVIPIGFFVGYAPPRLNPRDIRLGSEAEGGQFIGSALIRTGIEDRLELEYLDPAWVRSTWQPFADHAKRKGFFHAWYPTKYPDEVVYCWLPANANPDASNMSQTHMKVSMPMRGRAS